MTDPARRELRLQIAGRGGDGNITLGEILGKVLARRGYHVVSYRTYPAEIEGGVAQIVLRVSVDPLHSVGTGTELAAVLSHDAFEEIKGDLRPDSFVLYDQTVRTVAPFRGQAIEATKIARWTYGNPKLKNLIMLGALGRLLGLDMEDLIAAAHERMRKVGSESIEATVRHGADLLPQGEPGFRLAAPLSPPQLLLTGNQAVGFGAVRAGCQYVAGYPITPASPLLEYLAKTLPALGGTVLQAEDEMAAIGSCLGASYTGLKALTPTSGPGFALMSEMVNLGVMAELPLVIVDVQRAGPSTGMPSKTEQGDLLYALYGSPGESPRVVLAASDVRDAYTQTIRAFNLAEELQCPVVLLTDQSLAYRQETVDESFGREPLDLVTRARMSGAAAEEYQRFAQTESGASAVSLPGGDDAPFMTTGLEHDEAGRENYSADVHERMTAKRFRKLEQAARLAVGYEQDFETPPGARVGVIGWGGTRGAICEAVASLAEQGVTLARMHLHTLRPLPEDALRAFTAGLEKLVVVEENFSGQLALLLRGVVDCEVVAVTKCAGLPFGSGDVAERVRALV